MRNDLKTYMNMALTVTLLKPLHKLKLYPF